MTMQTYASLFSGGGLADIGAVQAGLTPIWAVEYDNAIADVYRANLGDHCLTADVCAVDYSSLQVPTWLHMSPVCTRASVANSDATESELDIAMAQACTRAIAQRPPYVSLENVWGYRTFESFKIICRALVKYGYNFNFWHLNAANYGVPQTRKRMILIASRVKHVHKPIPTHTENPELSMWFDSLPKWIGWHEVIKDLFYEFVPIYAAYIEKLLSSVVRQLVLIATDNVNRALTILKPHQPSMTVTAHYGTRPTHMPVVITNDKFFHVSPRALARFQGVPDTYQLPEKQSLACKIIGNGVPPAFIRSAILANIPIS